jgi:hypothetical protein
MTQTFQRMFSESAADDELITPLSASYDNTIHSARQSLQSVSATSHHDVVMNTTNEPSLRYQTNNHQVTHATVTDAKGFLHMLKGILGDDKETIMKMVELCKNLKYQPKEDVVNKAKHILQHAVSDQHLNEIVGSLAIVYDKEQLSNSRQGSAN